MGFERTVVFAVLVAAELVGNAAAATYVVGDSLGWSIPDGDDTYEKYASQHVFALGDVLVFNFTTGEHDVARVTKSAYDKCSSDNPISISTVGPASVTLNSAGRDYYICTFDEHCGFGQRLAINVSASKTIPIPSPTLPPTSPSITPSPISSLTPPASAPSPLPGTSPSPSTSPPTRELRPPPAPGSATIRTCYAALAVVFASLGIGLLM